MHHSGKLSHKHCITKLILLWRGQATVRPWPNPLFHTSIYKAPDFYLLDSSYLMAFFTSVDLRPAMPRVASTLPSRCPYSLFMISSQHMVCHDGWHLSNCFLMTKQLLRNQIPFLALTCPSHGVSNVLLTPASRLHGTK